MPYYTIDPPPHLSAFVRFFWVFELEVPLGQDYVYRSMADGCTELLFHYKGVFTELTSSGMELQPRALLHAQSSRYKRFLTKESFGIFGIYLFPFAVPYLYNIASSEVSSRITALSMLDGADGRELEEKMMLAENNAARVAIASSYLSKKLAPVQNDRALTACVKQILHSEEPPGIPELARLANISARQLERKFKEQVGFTPKLFSRIVRFQKTLKEYPSCKSLTDIAHSCGYYDQSHFIHEFAQFSGYSPKQYFSGRPEGIEWKET